VSREHHYRLDVVWTGNTGAGTAAYRAYRRDHEITAPGKSAPLPGSSDPAFHGDPSRYSPEELLVAALSACHMLWMLHLCSVHGIVVTAYHDAPRGTMVEHPDASGEFTEVVLAPRIRLADPAREPELARLHEQAHELCFIARSVRFSVRVDPGDGSGR
jgi:organic hydroperoxide reductase OsmC/OhrA